MNDDDPPIIYESPDGGKTVYGRFSGSLDRWSADDHEPFGLPLKWGKPSVSIRLHNLKKIVELAETNPTLNDQLTKLEELYILVRDENH